MKQETIHIPPLNDAPNGTKGSIVYDGNQTPAQLFTMRGHNSKELYALVIPPHSRPFTRVSVVKQEFK